MARIVSGAQQQDPNFALMQGLEIGRTLRQSQPDQAEQLRLMLQIKDALMEQDRLDLSKRKEERALQEYQREIQDGSKAGRLQQLTQKAQAGQINPGQKMVERIIGARGRLKDPKALAMFDDSVSSLLKTQQQAKKRKAAEEALGMAEQDTDVFPPEMVQALRQELDAGGDIDSIPRRLGEHRYKAAELQQIMSENEQLAQQAAARVQAAAPGYGKRSAEIALNAYMSANSLKSRRGSGAQLLKSVDEALLGPRSEYGQGQGDPYADRMLFQTAYDQLEKEGGLPVSEGDEAVKEAVRARMRMINSDLPPPQAEYAERVPVMKIDGTVRSVLREGGGIKEIRAALEAQGIEPTRDIANMVQYALRGYTAEARNASADAQRR